MDALKQLIANLPDEQLLLLGLTAVFVLGIGSQWMAWRVRVPSILLLLVTGFTVGPVAGWLDPDELLGGLLFPIVSLSVAIVLFEGSLSLRLSDLRGVGGALRNILTTGVFVTWLVVTAAAYWVLQFEFSISLLLGAMLTVTGPTVVGPMLRLIRPTGKVSSIARWEGIVVDPIGAVLAVLVLETIEPLRSSAFGEAISEAGVGLVETVVIGGLLGGVTAMFLAAMLKRHWIPDHLQSPVTLMLVLAAFVASNLLKHESGLLTVTVMGVLLANQQSVVIKHILEFKENLTILLISSLFILLSARVELVDFVSLSWRGPVFVTVVILIARPASIFLSTIGTDLSWREKVFLSWLAPRGIVAAAVASVFALRLGETGTGLVPATFLVIVGTVVVYGLTAFPLARKLGLATANPQGVLIASAHPGARAIGHAVQDAGFSVVLVDTNSQNIQAARMEGLPTFYANILSERAIQELDLGGIGRFLALTSNDEVNSLASMHFSEVFGRSRVYQLPPVHGNHRTGTAGHILQGRFLFDADATFALLDKQFEAGAVVKTTSLSEEFSYETFQERYGDTALLLFVIPKPGELVVVTPDKNIKPKAGDKVIALVAASAPDAEHAT